MFCERPRANKLRPYRKKDREFHVLCPLSRLDLQGIVRCTVGRNIAFLREEGGTRSVTEGVRVTLDLHYFYRNALSLTRLRRELPPGGSLWFVRSESPFSFPDKHCFCGHKSKNTREQKLGYNVIKALKSSVSLIGSKQRLLFKHRMKSSISVISESVTGCSSSISENSGAVNFIVFW